MGITGLLPFVKNSCRPANIKDFSGATVAIDAYSWLHKGAFSCAEKLVKGEKTDGYVYYCVKQLNMLLDAGVKPIMVFDGCNLASKAVTEKKRRENRDKTRQRGKELLCEGKVKEARECFQRCVDVTPEMAREVIEACRKKSIDCIVAPYEADAQMAYLDKIGVTQLTITEDSDLILFGCTKILFKMDSCGGGMLFEKENLNKSFGGNASKYSFEKFRYMCILSGCDYLPSLPGIGLAKAFKFFSLTTNTDLSVVLSKLPSYLKMPKLSVSKEYIDSFIKADNTFLYQLVFCPMKKCLVPLNPYSEGVNPSDMDYAGKYLDDDLAYQLAKGDINVKTLTKYNAHESQNSSDFHGSKSDVWSSLNNSAVTTKVSKKETAFKFSTPKRKVEDIHKYKAVEQEERNESDVLSTEELFSMYGGSAKKSKSYDPYEEEPIFVCSKNKEKKSSFEAESVQNSSSPPIKKLVKSRFFSSESVPSSIESSSGYFSSPSSVNNSMNEDFLSNTLVSDSSIPTLASPSSVNNSTNEDFLSNALASDSTLASPAELDHKLEKNTNLLDQPNQSNKENMINRFAKKKPTIVSPVPNEDKDISTTPSDKSASVLDVFSTESTAATSTISSTQKSGKILSQAIEEGSVVKIKPKNLFCKKNKLITTKIQDYTWKKEESISKVTEAEKSSEESIEQFLEIELVEESPLKDIVEKSPLKDIDEKSPLKDVVEKSPLKEISPYFLNVNDNPCDEAQEESVITIESDCDDPDYPTSNVTAKTSDSPKTVDRKNLKRPSSNDKLGKCRAIGLSKKRKSTGAASRKETLLNFNFTRQSVAGKSS